MGKTWAKTIGYKASTNDLQHFVGRERESTLNRQCVFPVSKGHCEQAQDCVVKALTNLQEEYIRWPDAYKRKQSRCCIEEKYHIPNVLA